MVDLMLLVEELKSKRIIKKDIEIAEKTGYSKQLVSNYISGRQKPSKAFLDTFSEVFSIDTMILQEPETKYGNGKLIPVYEAKACAGNGLKNETEKIIGHFYADRLKGCECGIFVDGDSMYPKYSSGDIIGLMRIHNTDLIVWGKAYVILDNQNHDMIIRYIEPVPDDPESWLLIAENDKYKPIIFKKSWLAKLWRIQGVFKSE